MTDNEIPRQCRAQLTMDDSEPYRCTLIENHAAMHRDRDGDTWDITYVDAPAKPLGERVDHLLLGNLSRRTRALEAAWTVGGETLSERLDRVILGMQEQHRSVATRVGMLETAVLTHPEECRCLPCVTPSAQPPENEAVLIDPVELGKLLEVSERLTALEAEAAAHDRQDTEHECGPAC